VVEGQRLVVEYPAARIVVRVDVFRIVNDTPKQYRLIAERATHL
jgi:hypothetical protein